MKNLILPLAVVAGLILYSCAEEDSCPNLWQVDKTQESMIAEIDLENESLSLQASDMGGEAGEIYQAYFTGDFDVIASFNSFMTTSGVGSNGRAYVEMFMTNTAVADTVLDTASVRVGIRGDAIYAYIGGTYKMEKSYTPGAEGTGGIFRIRKSGNALIGQMIAAGDTTQVSAVVPSDPERFGFRMGTLNDSVVAGITAIKISQFNVIGTGSTSLYGDDFICNSIYTE